MAEKESAPKKPPAARKKAPVRRKKSPAKKAPEPQHEYPGRREMNAPDVQWALDVMWAVDHVNEARVSVRRAGSASRHAIWSFGRESTKELMVQMVPRALNILEKNRPHLESEEALAEKRSVEELKKLLTAAVQEAAELE